MIDRITKRSRGFGFVTFAKEVSCYWKMFYEQPSLYWDSENYLSEKLTITPFNKQEVALSLLNSIPGKTGMINIQGKNCEIKASEPKSMNSSAPRYIHGSQRSPPTQQHQPPTQVYPKPPVAHSTLPMNKAYPYPATGMTQHPIHTDRYYDSRNFDQLYNHHTGYASNSIYGYQYSGYEASPYSPYQYGHSHQYPAAQGYYESSGAYSQYNYTQAPAGYGAYPNGYYSGPDYSGQTSSSAVPTSIQGAYRSDGSLESYGEYYEDGAE